MAFIESLDLFSKVSTFFSSSHIESLIQVSWNINEKETRDREIKGLMEASETTRCKNLLIITVDDEEEIVLDDKKIKVIPAWKGILGLI